jgi:transposase
MKLPRTNGVHPLQVTQWKKVALEGLPTLLSSRRGPKQHGEEVLKVALYRQIGQLKVELDWLKKSGPCPLSRSGR